MYGMTELLTGKKHKIIKLAVQAAIQKRQQDVKSLTLDFMSSGSKIVTQYKNFVLIKYFDFLYVQDSAIAMCVYNAAERFRQKKQANYIIDTPVFQK